MPKKTTTYLTTTTLWHNARKELPTESGYYIVTLQTQITKGQINEMFL